MLLNQPQHHQDVPAVEGEQCLTNLIFLSSFFFQPIEFTQIEHERRFKFVLKGIFILITVCVALLFAWTHIVSPGVLFSLRGMNILTGDMLDEPEVGKAYPVFLLFGNGAMALAMITAEICACIMRPASTIVHPVCSVGFVVNHIPFFTLNISIVLVTVVNTVTWVFFEFSSPYWLNMSAVMTSILVTNKGARAHVATRLRQQIDSFTIGGNNTVHPFVEIALVPLRSLAGPAPTMPTSTIAGPALVRFSNPLPRASGLENLTRPAPTLPTSTRATLCPVDE